MAKKITELYAFVVPNDDGGEGILAVWIENEKMRKMLVGCDMDHVRDLIPLADRAATAIGKKYRILRFDFVAEFKQLEEKALDSAAGIA